MNHSLGMLSKFQRANLYTPQVKRRKNANTIFGHWWYIAKDDITIYINCNNLFIFRYLLNIYYLLYLLILSIIIIFIYLLLFILDRGAYA